LHGYMDVGIRVMQERLPRRKRVTGVRLLANDGRLQAASYRARQLSADF